MGFSWNNWGSSFSHICGIWDKNGVDLKGYGLVRGIRPLKGLPSLLTHNLRG